MHLSYYASRWCDCAARRGKRGKRFSLSSNHMFHWSSSLSKNSWFSNKEFGLFIFSLGKHWNHVSFFSQFCISHQYHLPSYPAAHTASRWISIVFLENSREQIIHDRQGSYFHHGSILICHSTGHVSTEVFLKTVGLMAFFIQHFPC